MMTVWKSPQQLAEIRQRRAKRIQADQKAEAHKRRRRIAREEAQAYKERHTT